MSKLIPLTKGQFAIVDDADFDWLMQWRWHVSEKGYAIRYSNRKRIRMHRFITGVPLGEEVDHKNRNKLDNQRHNLRPATRAQQAYNRSKHKITTSPFKGVYWDKQKNKWHARIKLNRKFIHLGFFASDADAAKAYDEAAYIYFGEFAATNF